MAPTESKILANFLLSPAALPNTIRLTKFTDLFPKAQRSNPQIELLYRELQHIRALDTDEVQRNITQEVKRGERQRRDVVKARRKADREDMEGVDMREIEMETELFGLTSNLPISKPHTLSSILPDIEQACAELETEVLALAAETRLALEDIKTTVGDLSDLRYGRFSRPTGTRSSIGEDVIEALEGFEEVCHSITRTSDEA